MFLLYWRSWPTNLVCRLFSMRFHTDPSRISICCYYYYYCIIIIFIIIFTLLHYVYIMISYSTFYAFSLKLPDTRKFPLLCNLLNQIRFPERFMRNIKRIFVAANIENRKYKQELNICLRSYRTASHSSTGVPPHTAPHGRAMWTKPPEAPPSLSRGEEMKIKDQQSKDEMKIYADYWKHAKPPNLVPNDQLLVHKGRSHQRKTEAYYKPRASTVIDKKGSMVTARNGKHSITRNSSMFKPFRSVTESVKIESDNGIMVRSPDKYSAPVNKRKLLKKGDTLLELQGKIMENTWCLCIGTQRNVVEISLLFMFLFKNGEKCSIVTCSDACWYRGTRADVERSGILCNLFVPSNNAQSL